MMKSIVESFAVRDGPLDNMFESSSGHVEFLPDGTLLIALMSGLAEIVDLDLGSRVDFASVRGFDAIDVSADGELIAMARRSRGISETTLMPINLESM